MKLLEEKLSIGGFAMRQISRDGDVAVYEKRWQGLKNGALSYEVVIIQRRPAETLFGREVPERELFPPSSSWGELGWTYNDRDRALEKALEVSVAQLNQKGRARIPFHRQGVKQGRKTGQAA